MAMNEVIVVLAHGGWADGSSWARVITGLAAHAYARAVIGLAHPTPSKVLVSIYTNASGKASSGSQSRLAPSGASFGACGCGSVRKNRSVSFSPSSGANAVT